MHRLFVGLLLLVLSASVSTAQPFTRRSSQMQHDGLKKYVEISNFRLGGKYDLNDPAKWENGGEGGVTLESLGGGKLRTAQARPSAFEQVARKETDVRANLLGVNAVSGLPRRVGYTGDCGNLRMTRNCGGGEKCDGASQTNRSVH